MWFENMVFALRILMIKPRSVDEKTGRRLNRHGISPKERRAKLETEQLLFCWGKSCVFSNSLA